MEPLDEKELSHLLSQWDAPAAPASLGRRVLPRRGSWWRWLFTGTIRIPVPVGVAAVVLVGLWIHYSKAPAAVPIAIARRPPRKRTTRKLTRKMANG